MYENEIRKLIQESGAPDPHAIALRASRQLSLEAMNTAITSCCDCESCRQSGCLKAMPAGSSSACILVINDYLSEPCQDSHDSPEYKLFMKALKAYHVDESKIYWLNLMSCVPVSVVSGQAIQRQPATKEMKNCGVFVDYAMKVIDPVMVILLGGFACSYFGLGAVTECAGKWSKAYWVEAMPTYSPGYILRYESMDDPDGLAELKEEFSEDLLKAFLRVQEEYPEFHVTTKALRREDFT